MSITRHSAALLAVANPALICPVMRSNESLQASRLMNWNHCEGRNTASSSSAGRAFPTPRREWGEGRGGGEEAGSEGRKEGRTSLSWLFISYPFFTGPAADCVSTHLSPSARCGESPVQLTSTISREAKAPTARWGCCFRSTSQVGRPRPPDSPPDFQHLNLGSSTSSLVLLDGDRRPTDARPAPEFFPLTLPPPGATSQT